MRLVWNLVWTLFARPLPRSVGRAWKCFLLRLFGAKIHNTAVIYSSATIYMPQNLEMDAHSIMGPQVDCYNVAPIHIGSQVVISQKSYLCTASHDHSQPNMPLISAPIIIEDQAWIAADSFIGMGVIVGQGSVVGARSSVYKNVAPWSIVGGNPARFIKNRIIYSKRAEEKPSRKTILSEK